MINEFQLAIVVAAVAVFIVLLYFVMRKSADSATSERDSAIQKTPELQKQETIQSVPDVKEEEPEVAEVPAPQSSVSESTSRRKSDKISPKRTVPELGKITKENFSEFAGERILVAEDNPINQKVISGLLADSGIELVMAYDGQEALDILENDSNFVMILMDAHMPRVDGFEATRIIREQARYDHILVVALSGDTATDDIQKMKNAGMDEQLAKPLRMDALYKIIYAYANKESKSAEPTKTVETIKNLDVAKGLETCGGDEGFYREILSEFMADYGSSSDSLGTLLRSHNIHAADALLLDIIGVTENIGAQKLAQTATNLKLALRDTDERSYLSLFDQYRNYLERLKDEIQAYL